jgi:hypothetical protein
MPAPVALGLLESLPIDAMVYADDKGRSIPVLISAKHTEVSFELIRIVMAALGVKRSRIPSALNLLGTDAPNADRTSPDPRAWSKALGANVVKV